jgi:hypothetical protein
VIPRLADGKFGQLCAHNYIMRQVRQLG